MEKAYLSLSFDDGRIDNYTTAYPILKKYQLPATFNITTGYVEGKFERGRLTYAEPMTTDMIKALYKDPLMEIAGHGYWHMNTVEDITMGVNGLRRHLGKDRQKVINGFASPGTGLDLDYYHTHRQELTENGIQYVRLSLRYLSHPKLKTIIRKLSRLLKSPILYKLAYQDTLMSYSKNGIIYSIPVLQPISVRELKCLINHAVREKKVCILMFHSIVDDSQIKDNWDFKKSKFELLCQYLYGLQKDGKLDVVTSQVVIQYLNSQENHV